jgi:hypothetical protein
LKESGSMKPTQARIADLWCRLMHTAPMWPLHGQYECRTCGLRHRVCWEQPQPSESQVTVLPRDRQFPSTLGNGKGIADPVFVKMARVGSRERL